MLITSRGRSTTAQARSFFFADSFVQQEGREGRMKPSRLSRPFCLTDLPYLPDPPSLEVELRGDLEEPRRHDRQRVEIRRTRSRRCVGALVDFGRVRVEQVVDVE